MPIDLQAVFNRCYEAGPYRREVRYGEDVLSPPLSHERTAWAQRLFDSAR